MWLNFSRKTRSPTASGPPSAPCSKRWVPSTLTVTNNLDGGAGSLRAEIAARSNDSIAFAPNLDGQTITLTSGELLIKKNLTIAGPGAGELTISGNHDSRVFEVAKLKQVTLNGLMISHGLANGATDPGDEGGGILQPWHTNDQ